MICPQHKILMDYSVEMLRWLCPWPDCELLVEEESQVSFADQAAQALGRQVDNAVAPTVEETWSKIDFDVSTFGDKVTIKATLPEGFSQREFTRIYHLRDAADFGMNSQQWIEYQKEQMFQDLIKRIKATF